MAYYCGVLLWQYSSTWITRVIKRSSGHKCTFPIQTPAATSCCASSQETTLSDKTTFSARTSSTRRSHVRTNERTNNERNDAAMFKLLSVQQYSGLHYPFKISIPDVVDVGRRVDSVDDVQKTADPLSSRSHLPPSAPCSKAFVHP